MVCISFVQIKRGISMLLPMKKTGSVFPVKALWISCVALAASIPAPAVEASEAVIVEVYEGCNLSDTNVVIGEGALTPHDSAEVKARIAAASKDSQAAVPRIAQILKNHGIDDVRVARQGFEGCEPKTSGKYVEAVGTYCGPRLTHAEVLVDRKSFMSVSEPQVSFDEFLRGAVKRLRGRGIFDRPVVSIENAPKCEESS